jgi:uncharacterized OB-fold protein
MTAEVWMGYLVDATPDFTVVQSPFVRGGVRVFGADSDATTMAVAVVLHRLQHEAISTLGVPDGIDAATVSVACSVNTELDESDEEPTWDLLLSDEATLILARQGAPIELTPMDVEIEVDEAFHAALEQAWSLELLATHVSQGAYVSKSQYEEAVRSRLMLEGQLATAGIVWPPRYSGLVDHQPVEHQRLVPRGVILSWTTLSASGAPSEFALRAPLLGGISTVLLALEDGPNGVFLMVDDEEGKLEIGDSMELVLRRIYAQEGFIRYGLKARSIQT